MENLEVMRAASNYNAHIARMLLTAAMEAPSRRLAIDFGAGLGTFTAHVAPLFGRVIAVEIEDASVVELRAQGLDVRTDVADLEDDSADFVFSISVLEHIDDDVGALKEIRRVLKPGGALFIYVPAFEQCWSKMDDVVGHRRRYTRETLAARLRHAGLQPMGGRYVDSLGAIAALAMRLSGSAGTLSRRGVSTYDRWVFPASRALDRLLGSSFGKNVMIRAIRAG